MSPAVLVVGEHHDLADLVAPGIERVHVQLAETLREIALLQRRQLLVGEEEHEMLVERLADLRDGGVVERRGQIDALDGRADDGRQGGRDERFTVAGNVRLGKRGHGCSLSCAPLQRQRSPALGAAAKQVKAFRFRTPPDT
jgi:hypothetical protein